MQHILGNRPGQSPEVYPEQNSNSLETQPPWKESLTFLFHTGKKNCTGQSNTLGDIGSTCFLSVVCTVGADLIGEAFIVAVFVLASNTLLRPAVNRINRQRSMKSPVRRLTV